MEKQKHILYTLAPEQMEILQSGDKYFEIWQGLPDLPFVDGTERCRGGHYSLICEHDGHYIWVTNDAAVALKDDPKAILTALIKKQDGVKLHADVDISSCQIKEGNALRPETLEELIERMKRLNRDKVTMAIQKANKKVI